ncbi:MAG: ABC transporter substrate-binding protein [Armatimonadetes bacterium]|nr:ABC transporter substrate-binding protein [Armatimonadota bacterium]
MLAGRLKTAAAGRIVLRVAIGLAAASSLFGAGCSPRRSTPAGTSFTVWSMWSGQEERNFEAVLQRYEQLHPGVHIRNLGAVADDTKTIRAIVAGVPPDLFTLSDPSYLGPLARDGALTPLDSRFAASGIKTHDYVPASLRLCMYNGHLYGIPFLIDDEALLWNKAEFRAAGLNPDRPPQTLGELANDAVRLTKRTPAGAIGTLGMRPVSDLYTICALFGGRLADASGRTITAADTGNIAALTWYKRLVDREGGAESVDAFATGFGSDQGGSNPFFTGKVAMMINGEWNPYWISRYAPSLDYGVAPIPPPAADPQRLGTTWVGGNVFCIPKESRHPLAAWRFLVWTQSREAQVMFARRMNNVPNILSVLSDPALRTGAPFRSRYAIFLNLAAGSQTLCFPPMPVASLYNNQMSNAIERVLLGDLSPTAALQGVQTRVQSELNRS